MTTTRPVYRLFDDLRGKIVDHCLASLPHEGCGLLALSDHRVVAVYPTVNLDSSAISYTVPPDAHFEALVDCESRGWALGGVFHSHPNGPARLSPIDIRRALEPRWLYLVVGLIQEPQMRAWHVRDGHPTEVSIVG